MPFKHVAGISLERLSCGVQTSQMTRAVTRFSRSQGMTAKVEGSGLRNMSLSAMRANPSTEEPSNQTPS